jgi:hypothetical protein
MAVIPASLQTLVHPQVSVDLLLVHLGQGVLQAKHLTP